MKHFYCPREEPQRDKHEEGRPVFFRLDDEDFYILHGQNLVNPVRFSAGPPCLECVCPTVDRGLPSLNLVGSRGVGRAADTPNPCKNYKAASANVLKSDFLPTATIIQRDIPQTFKLVSVLQRMRRMKTVS